MSTLAPQRVRRLAPTRLPAGRAEAVCVALAALSLVVPSEPTTDPWAWIVWGHELLWGGFTTLVGGAPSWKPLPVLFTTPLSLADHAAPALWLLVARAGGLYSLVVAHRLGDRLGGAPAGVLAAVGLVLSDDWVKGFAHGYSEPLAIGLLLAAIDGHLRDRPSRTLVLLTATALVRPEAWPLVLLYAVWAVRRSRVSWRPAAALGAAVPLLWVVPDWIGSGTALHGGEIAKDTTPHGLEAALQAIADGALTTPLPLTLCALAAVPLAGEARRPVVRTVAILAGAWAAAMTILVLVGYPASARYFVLPAALICVVGAVGAVFAFRSPRGRRAAPVLAVLLAVGLVVPAVDAGNVATGSVRRANLERDLATAIARAGPGLRRCGQPLLPNGLAWTRGKLAFVLDVQPMLVALAPTNADRYVASLAGVDPGTIRPAAPSEVLVWLPQGDFIFLAPFGGANVHAAPPGRRLRQLAAAGVWRVLVPENSARCGTAV